MCRSGCIRGSGEISGTDIEVHVVILGTSGVEGNVGAAVDTGLNDELNTEKKVFCSEKLVRL